MRKYLVPILVISLIPIFAWAIPVKDVSAACTIKTSWIRNLKPTTVKTIYIDDISQYILSLEVRGCAGNKLWGAYNRTQDVQGYDIFPEQALGGDLVKSVKFDNLVNNTKPDTYKFQFAVLTPTNQVLSYAKDIIVEFKLGTAPDKTGNSNNPPTNTTTNTTTQNNSTPNALINTGVTATYKEDLDSALGYFINPLTKDTLPELLASILRILFILIGMISVIIIIIAGFRMVIASGNETELTKAKAAITWAIIGLIVSLMSFSIVAIIQRLIQVGA